MTLDELCELARLILEDFDARRPGRCAELRTGLTIEQAYSLQQAVVTIREQRGEKVIGYKIGCTSRPIQVQLGVKEPIFGRLFDTECFPSGARLLSAHYANLAIEGELAIRLSHDLPCRSLSDEEYIRAIGSVMPVIELHHYVVPQNAEPLCALIASSGMHAGLVLPLQETTCSGRVPTVKDLDVTINDRVVGTASEPWTMGGPALALRWLTSRLAESGLQVLRRQVILTGSALPLFPVKPGSRVVAKARPLGMSFVKID